MYSLKRENQMSKLGQMTCECDTDVACCVALGAEPIDTVRAEDLAEAFGAIGDPYRMAIVHLIATTGQAVCVVDVERHLPLAQSTVSYHLKVLLEAGVIDREKRGRWSYYSLNPNRLTHMIDAISAYRDRVTVAA
ncbi:MAG: transcriptional regulator [Actinobacteria bacterium]|nr:MAG: transcriptional regulator [Actinomycetota bacterium]